MFTDQPTHVHKPVVKKVRCRECEACKREDCKKCKHCLDMKMYGGPGKMKQTCITRKCMNRQFSKRSRNMKK